MGELSLQQPYLCRYYYGYNQYDSVRRLQEVLNEKCLSNLPVDGYFGRATEEAVKEHQRANNLRVDGIVGPETLASLNRPKQNYAFIPDNDYSSQNSYDDGLLSGSRDVFLGNPISDVGTNMSSVDDAYDGGLIQAASIGSTPMFSLKISYDEIMPFASFLPLPKDSNYKILTDCIFNPANRWVNAVSIYQNLISCRNILNMITNLENTEYVFSQNNVFANILHGSDRVGQRIGLYFGTGRFNFQAVESVVQQGRVLIHEFSAFITNLLGLIGLNRLNDSIIMPARNLINRIVDFVIAQFRRIPNILNSRLTWINGFNNRLRHFSRLFPPLKVLAVGLNIIPLIAAIIQGDKAQIIECLLTMVKDMIVGVVSSAIITALMAVGVGEVAIALVILVAILDYFFFHPDPENALIHGARNVIHEGVVAVQL